MNTFNSPSVTIGKLRAVQHGECPHCSVYDDASDPTKPLWEAVDLDSAKADMERLDVYLQAMVAHRAKLSEANVDNMTEALFNLPDRLMDIAFAICHARKWY
jgi:hypothetical protein